MKVYCLISTLFMPIISIDKEIIRIKIFQLSDKVSM